MSIKTDVNYLNEYVENEVTLREAVSTLVNNKEVFIFKHEDTDVFFTNGIEEANEAVEKLNKFTQKTGEIIENTYASGFKNGMLFTVGLGLIAVGGYVYTERGRIAAKIKRKINELNYKEKE